MVALRIISSVRALSKWFSGKTLTKKASLNGLAGAVDQGAQLVVGLVINPLLVAGLGSNLFGVWHVLSRLIGYVTPAGGRPTQTLKWTIANQQASTDYQEKRRYVGSAVVVLVLFGPLVGSLGGLLAWFAPVWLDAPPEFWEEIRLAAALLIANLILMGLVDVPRAVLKGENLGYKRMGLSALLILIGGGFTAVAIYCDAGLVGLATAVLATTLLSGVLFFWVTRVHVHWFGISKPTIKAVRDFFGLSGWFLLSSLVAKLLTTSDVVILGIFDSPELVTSYAFTKYAPASLMAIGLLLVAGILPGLGGIIGSGGLQKAARVRNEIMAFTWLWVTVVGATTLLWNQSFVRLWVGAEYYAGATPTLLIIVMIIQFQLIRTDSRIIDVTLNVRTKVIAGLVSSILSIVIAGILVGITKTGIIGLCLGLIAGRSFISLIYPWLAGRFLGISLRSQLKGILRPMLITVVLFACIISVGPYLIVNSWLSLVLSAGVSLGAVSVFTFYTGLTRDQRTIFLRRTGKVLSRV